MLPDASRPTGRSRPTVANGRHHGPAAPGPRPGSSPQPSHPSSPPAREAAEARVRQALEESLGPRTYRRCFRAGATLGVERGVLTVSVADAFTMRWAQREFGEAISEVAREVLGPATEVRFAITAPPGDQHTEARDDSVSMPSDEPAAEPTVVSAARQTAKRRRAATRPAEEDDTTDARSTAAPSRRTYARLDELVPCEGNRLVLTAARQVSERPGALYNPLVIFGGTGTGKTHVLEGIAREVRRRDPRSRVLFMTSENFTNTFTAALRDRTTPGFRQRFRGVDVLLLDDFDFFQRKAGIAEEVLHTLRELESRGKQVVLTLDRHPRLLDGFADELVTRCLGGLIGRLETPDAAAREQIVLRRAAELGLEIKPPAVQWIARRFANVRECVGAVNTLATQARLSGENGFALAAARKALSELERDCARVVGLPEIDAAVCRLFGVTSDQLRSTARSRSLSRPRMLAMFLARRHTRAAYSEIGQYFGGRNHSTVISAERKVADWLRQDDAVKVVSESWSVGEVLSTLERRLSAG
jgi:chromosomal replication initiator protein